MILTLLGYIGVVAAFVALTMAIASGLYYLSEQVEEYTVYTKKLLTRLIYSIIGVHVLLLIIDRFPFKLTIFSIIAHVVYLQNLNRFPFINLASGTFISSCVMVCLNHWFWFKHFSDPNLPPYAIYSERPTYQGETHPPFIQVASFFGICVWLIPFALFISLSASENVLPYSSETEDVNKPKKRSSVAKVLVQKLYDVIAIVGNKLGYDWDFNQQRIIA